MVVDEDMPLEDLKDMNFAKQHSRIYPLVLILPKDVELLEDNKVLES
jgi:hypothetical protein